MGGRSVEEIPHLLVKWHSKGLSVCSAPLWFNSTASSRLSAIRLLGAFARLRGRLVPGRMKMHHGKMNLFRDRMTLPQDQRHFSGLWSPRHRAWPLLRPRSMRSFCRLCDSWRKSFGTAKDSTLAFLRPFCFKQRLSEKSMKFHLLPAPCSLLPAPHSLLPAPCRCDIDAFFLDEFWGRTDSVCTFGSAY
jgi:hypothetical protein